MSDDNQLAVGQQQSITLHDQMAWATQAAKSSIIPRDYEGKPSNILIAVGFGQSMGLSPAESLYRINVIQGKPTMSAELIAAQVRKAGHKLRLQKDPVNQSVTCIIVRADDPQYPISVTRDAAWARSMGLSGKDNYHKQPMTMLTWRAITACAREACPEALYGVAYTPDELSDVDGPGEAISAEATVQDVTPEPIDTVPVTETVARSEAAETGPTSMQRLKATLKRYGDLTGTGFVSLMEGVGNRHGLPLTPDGRPDCNQLTDEQCEQSISEYEALMGEVEEF